MKRFGFAVVIAATMVVPALAREKPVEVEALALVSASFPTGLEQCSVSHINGGYVFSGSGRASFKSPGGVAIDFESEEGATPLVYASAVQAADSDTTAARDKRISCSVIEGQIHVSTRVPQPLLFTNCTVSGNSEALDVSFSVRLAPQGGHVTLIKREGGSPPIPTFVRRGYQYYQAHSDLGRQASDPDAMEMTVVATCDSSGLTAKGSKPSTATYDLAVGKKA